MRGKADVPTSISEQDLTDAALANEGVVRSLDGRGIRKVIVRAPKLVNIVPE